MSLVTLISKDGSMVQQVTEDHAGRIMKIQKAMRSDFWRYEIREIKVHQTEGKDVDDRTDKRPRKKKAEQQLS